MNFVTSIWGAQTNELSGHLTKRSADKFSIRKKVEKQNNLKQLAKAVAATPPVLSSGHSVFKTAALSIQW